MWSGRQFAISMLPRVMAAARCEGARLDAVGNDAVAAAVQTVYALNRMVRVPSPSTCAPMARRKLGQIDDLRLARRVVELCLASSQAGGHHQILPSRDRDGIHE